MENSLVMWTCGTHSNRLFLANARNGTVTQMALDEECYNEYWMASFNCPTVLFGGNVLGVRVRSKLELEYVKMDIINVSTNQLLEKCPANRNLQHICSEQYLNYIMEVQNTTNFLLLCIEKKSYKIRKANFPCYPHGFYNDIRMIVSQAQELFIHVISNEVILMLTFSNNNVYKRR
jgi:hypothetical protein